MRVGEVVEDADRVDEVEPAASLGRSEREPEEVALHHVDVAERREVGPRGVDGGAQIERDDLLAHRTARRGGRGVPCRSRRRGTRLPGRTPVDGVRASRGTAPRTRGGTRRSAATASRTPTRSRAAARRGRAGRAAGCRPESPSDDRSRRTRASRTRPRPIVRRLEPERVARQRADEILDEARASLRPRHAGVDAELDSGARPFLDPAPVPELEHEQRPQLLPVVAPAGEMLATRAAAPRARRRAPGAQPRRRQLVLQRLAQLRLEPGGDRDAEALLRPARDPRRQHVAPSPASAGASSRSDAA